MARVDFFVTADNEIVLNEINTLPGFTNISMYPQMWQASGLNYQDLLVKLIELGLSAKRKSDYVTDYAQDNITA